VAHRLTKATGTCDKVHPNLPPWRWKIGLLLSSNVHTVVRDYGGGNSFSVRTCAPLSSTGLTSHKTVKNLCERDALPTELYSGSFSAPKQRRRIRTEFEAEVHLFAPNDLLSVHFCSAKLQHNDVRIDSRLCFNVIAKRSRNSCGSFLPRISQQNRWRYLSFPRAPAHYCAKKCRRNHQDRRNKHCPLSLRQNINILPTWFTRAPRVSKPDGPAS
jgi:hypothetical protein